MIRDATQKDMARLVEMGRLFHAAADAGDIPSFDPISFQQTATWLIDSPTGVLLVITKDGVHGMAGALIYPAWFNLAFYVAKVIFWWADPIARGLQATALRRALEYRLKELWGQNAIMLSLAGMRDEAMARLYRREGYRPMENTFIKRL